MPISKWVDQKTMVHLHNGILRSREKEGAYTLCNSMDGTGEHYAKWNKPGAEGQIPIKCILKNKIYLKMYFHVSYHLLPNTHLILYMQSFSRFITSVWILNWGILHPSSLVKWHVKSPNLLCQFPIWSASSKAREQWTTLCLY